MRKRSIATILVAAMCMSALTACQGNTSSDTSGNPSGGSGGNEEKSVTVTWLFPGDKAEDHDVVMEDLNKKIQEKLPNVQLEMQMVPQAEYNDKVTLAATSEQDFDLMFTSSWLNPFTTNLAREGLLELDDLAAKYGKEMLDSMPEWLLDAGRSNGKLYAIPNQQIIAQQFGVVVQKEYADKYGLNLTSMKSIEDLYPFLDKIVANEPDMFPIDQRQPMVLNQYENPAPGIYMKKGDESMKLLTWCDIIGEQDKMDKMWYDKGYIRKDIATVTDNTADVKANRYVASLGTYKPGWGAEFSSNYKKEYIDIPIEGAYVGATSGAETMTAINAKSKNPEKAMQLWNFIYTDKDVFNELLFGIEGTHYKKTGENSAEVLENSKYNYSGQAWKFGNQFLAYTLPGQPDDVWEKTAELNESAEISPMRGFTFDPTPVQAEIAQINAVIAEYRNMQYVAEDIEAHTAEKVDKMNKAGIDKVLKEVQSQLDEWKASK